MSVVALLFGLRGRIGRVRFIVTLLLVGVLRQGLLLGATVTLVGTGVHAFGADEAALARLGAVSLVIKAGVGWIGFALGAKRVHDLGRSAWLLTGFATASGAAALAAVSLAGFVVAWWVVAGLQLALTAGLACWPGQDGANRFGKAPSPRRPQVASDAFPG